MPNMPVLLNSFQQLPPLTEQSEYAITAFSNMSVLLNSFQQLPPRS